MHSLARNHASVDGNKRFALAAGIAMYGLSGRRFILANDEAYDLVIELATGTLDEVPEIVARLAAGTEQTERTERARSAD